VFTCALLNSQPMGFYAPAQLVSDARDHGVEVRPVDVNASGWNNGLEVCGGDALALRLGFRQIDGFRESWAAAIMAARTRAPFSSIEDLTRRAELPARALNLLAEADAVGSLGLTRRPALWDARRVQPQQLSLFAAMEADELGVEPDPLLPAMPLSEEVVADYQTTRLSLKAHPLAFLRASLTKQGILSCAQAQTAKDGARVRVAGIVIMRQRPGKGNAVFITLEDETGITNVLLWARDFEHQRGATMAARLMVAEGKIQRSKEGVVHLMAKKIKDATVMLDALAEGEATHPVARAHHPRNLRILPKSRDFH